MILILRETVAIYFTSQSNSVRYTCGIIMALSCALYNLTTVPIEGRQWVVIPILFTIVFYYGNRSLRD